MSLQLQLAEKSKGPFHSLQTPNVMELQVVAEMEMLQHCMVLVPVVLAALLALEGPGKILVVGVRNLRTAVVRVQLQVDMGQSQGQNLGWDWGQK